MNFFKKNFPAIILLSVVGLVFLALYLLKIGDDSSTVSDRDNDGFADNVDKCPDDYSETNNGCPAVAPPVVAEPSVPNPSNTDNDKDGYTANNDPDDKNPCIPSDTCQVCDWDGDNLTYAQEIKLKTDPKLKDSDGDGVDDNKDDCPLLVGKLNGCPDKDGDGVPDNKDKCPNIGKTNSKFKRFNARGCPMVDFALTRSSQNTYEWDLGGYDGPLELSISCSSSKLNQVLIDNNLHKFNVTGKSYYRFDHLPGSVNGRGDFTLELKPSSSKVVVKNAKLTNQKLSCTSRG